MGLRPRLVITPRRKTQRAHVNVNVYGRHADCKHLGRVMSVHQEFVTTVIPVVSQVGRAACVAVQGLVL